MKIALLQTGLDAKSRAANIQGLIAAIHRAVETSPAPDLLVLPGACDTGGAAAAASSSRATCQSVRGMIALKAREWGVYIAAGLHVRHGQSWVPSTFLFDPDGDDVAVAGPSTGDDAGSASEPAFWPCALGRIGVCEPPVSSLPTGADLPGEEGAFIALSTTLVARGRPHAVGEANLIALRDHPSARAGAHWGVVVPARVRKKPADKGGLTSFACGPEGTPLAVADTPAETILYADVPLAPALPAAETGQADRGGRAD